MRMRLHIGRKVEEESGEICPISLSTSSNKVYVSFLHLSGVIDIFFLSCANICFFPDHILLEDIESSRHGATVHGASIRLANANIFAGLYLCRLEPNEPPNELSSMRKVAREHLMYTLEIPFDALERVRRTELYVAPAAAWIAIAGPKLYQYSMSNADYTDKDVLLYWIGGVYGGLGL